MLLVIQLYFNCGAVNSDTKIQQLCNQPSPLIKMCGYLLGTYVTRFVLCLSLSYTRDMPSCRL